MNFRKEKEIEEFQYHVNLKPLDKISTQVFSFADIQEIVYLHIFSLPYYIFYHISFKAFSTSPLPLPHL